MVIVAKPWLIFILQQSNKQKTHRQTKAWAHTCKHMLCFLVLMLLLSLQVVKHEQVCWHTFDWCRVYITCIHRIHTELTYVASGKEHYSIKVNCIHWFDSAAMLKSKNEAEMGRKLEGQIDYNGLGYHRVSVIWINKWCI